MPVLGIVWELKLCPRSWLAKLVLEAGYQFGLGEIHRTPAGRDDPLFAGLGWSHVQLHHHGEAITTLPDGAKSGQVRRHRGSGFAKGLRTYGFQFHPECSRDRIMSWCGSEAQFMDKAGVTADAIERQLQQADGGYADYERNSFGFLNVWLLLMLFDRRVAGTSGERATRWCWNTQSNDHGPIRIDALGWAYPGMLATN